ncbi:arginine/serine-rich splicing factor RSP41 [Striga asiatica]|uniref:Arginine/serine-rich splicing factor RSP41 n=1 Tax=Striga asiatica TaxID=4170 RepID=A0A5A7PQ17_STRAF|nr:arginine/serine-rich splicing factor RSP41 [Striga asiatica]
MRPVFCGNLDYDARQSEMERLFRRYGKVDRVDMKSGFAFVYMEDERDAEDAIRALDRIEYGRKGRRLRVEWTKQERSSRRPESSRRSSSHLRPSKTLFVINFDPYNIKPRDLERHFDPYGKILNVRIRRNFAFVQFESQEDATRALDATNLSKLLGSVITVEYAAKDDDDRRNGYSPDRGRDRSPRKGYDRARSPSPRKRERESPDYGHGRARSPSPYHRERASPEYARGPSRSPSRKERDSNRGRGRSPRKERDTDYHHRRSPSPRNDRDTDFHHNHHKRSPSPQRERSNGDNGRVPDSGSPKREDGEKTMSPDDYSRNRSPAYSDPESPSRALNRLGHKRGLDDDMKMYCLMDEGIATVSQTLLLTKSLA